MNAFIRCVFLMIGLLALSTEVDPIV